MMFSLAGDAGSPTENRIAIPVSIETRTTLIKKLGEDFSTSQLTGHLDRSSIV